MKYFFIIITLYLSLLSCKNKVATIGTDCNIDSIVVKYLNGETTFNRPPRGIDILNWKSLKKHEALSFKYTKLIDTVITNCDYLKEIENEIKNLKNGECYDENVFFASIIFYKNSSCDSIYFSYGDGFTSIRSNEVCYQENRKLENLLYKYSDYYYWFSDLQ